MEQPTYTKKSDEPPQLNEPASPPALELPSGAGFTSKTARCSPDAVIALSASYLPRLTQRHDFWERRAAERCPDEFDLYQPERVVSRYPAALIDELLGR